MLSNDHDSERPSSAASAAAAENSGASETSDVTEEHRLTEEQPSPLTESAIGSGRLAQQRTPTADATIAVPKVCPQCASEYETTDRFCPKDGSPLRPKAGGDPLVGRVIADRYLVLALLGEGGMGRVYLGEHVKMNRQCAIKVMSPTLVNDAESLQRFAREASNAARILHPNVAAVFDYGESDKIIYLVMEYVDGESLSTILAREGALEPRRAIDLARQIADGLHAAHELGIVHRDLKPDNVIVAHSRSGKEIPKVVDFGIAKALTEAPQDALTRSGLVIGTPEYMSPEQLLGDPVDARADIYSLGCILYQMLTGAPAFSADTREQMIRRRLHEAPPHLREVLPELPSRLDTLIVHMLARSPADRLASAAEARDQLDPALAMGGWDPRVITAPSLSPGSSAAVSSAVNDPLMRPTLPLPRQKLNVRRIGAGVIIGSGLLLASLYLWTERAIADHRDHVALAPHQVAGNCHAEAGRNRGRTVRGAERVVFGFRALGEAGEPPALADGADPVAAAGQDLMRISLMAHVPDQPVIGGVEDIVDRRRELDHAQTGAQMATGDRNRLDGLAAQFVRQLTEIRRIELTKLGRGGDAV